MYRPQFPYATPPGYTDQDFTYSFDGNANTPLLSGNITVGTFIQNIVLPLEPDEVFMWRGWKMISPTITSATNVFPLYIQWKDPMGNYLSLCPVPAGHMALPSGAIGWGFAVVSIEPEIPCPAGSNVTLYITNPLLTGGGSVQALPRVALYGVKRGPLIPK